MKKRIGFITALASIFLTTSCLGQGKTENNPNNDVKREAAPLVKGLKTCPDDNHPHAIDLGLPSGTYWACCNLGASSPSEYGSLYTWGDIEPMNGNQYKYAIPGNDEYDVLFKDLDNDIAGSEYDAATQSWGSPWQLPTDEQMRELLKVCNKGEWTTMYGHVGRKFTAPNGGVIFLPANMDWEQNIVDEGEKGFYWSSVVSSMSKNSANELMIFEGSAVMDATSRSCGWSIRPVRNK